MTWPSFSDAKHFGKCRPTRWHVLHASMGVVHWRVSVSLSQIQSHYPKAGPCPPFWRAGEDVEHPLPATLVCDARAVYASPRSIPALSR